MGFSRQEYWSGVPCYTHTHTHTHTHTNIYIYIYIYRERERENDKAELGNVEYVENLGGKCYVIRVTFW